MLVKILVPWAGHHFSYMPGDHIDLPEAVAKARIAAGLCADPGLDLADDAASPTVKVPNLEDRSPEYATKMRKIDVLLNERGALLEKIAAAKRAIVAKNTGQIQPTKQSARIAELLGEAAPKDDAPGETLLAPAEISALESKAADYLAAITQLESEIEVHRQEASRKICDELSGEHKKLVAGICEALIETHKKWGAYSRFTGTLSGRNIAWSHLRAMHPLFLSDGPMDSQGNLARYLREAADAGIIPPEIIPAGLRSGAVGDAPRKAQQFPREPSVKPRAAR